MRIPCSSSVVKQEEKIYQCLKKRRDFDLANQQRHIIVALK